MIKVEYSPMALEDLQHLRDYVFYHLELDTVRIVRILNEQQDYMMQLFGLSKDIED